MIRLLAISGSLRRCSINTALLNAARRLAPPEMTMTLYPELGSLPLFNPDIAGAEPAIVHRLWKEIADADGVLIASPEYAHGVTGAMKNCLDWLVGGPEFVEKPVVVLNAAPRAHHAYDALVETVRTMNACFIENASLTIPIGSKLVTADEIMANPDFRRLITQSLEEFTRALVPFRKESGTFVN